jgi:hypothetical protein
LPLGSVYPAYVKRKAALHTMVKDVVIYILLFIFFSRACFRRGHWVLGLVGFIFPLLWIIGTILPSRYPIVRVRR